MSFPPVGCLLVLSVGNPFTQNNHAASTISDKLPYRAVVVTTQMLEERSWIGANRGALHLDIVPNQFTADIQFSASSAVFKSGWFRFLCLAAGVLTVGGLHFFRIRHAAALLRIRFEERLKERMRISRELHDTLLQNIASIALQLNALSRANLTPEEFKDHLRRLCGDAEDCLNASRATISDFRVPVPVEQDLISDLRILREHVARESDVRFDLVANVESLVVAPQLQEHLLRIIHEGVRNACQHSGASEVRVTLHREDCHRVRVQIQDKGRGFDYDAVSNKPSHWGLAAMQERARELGAEFSISAFPGKGVTIDLVVPLDRFSAAGGLR